MGDVTHCWVVDEDSHPRQNTKYHQSPVLIRIMSAHDDVTPFVWTLRYAHHHYVLSRKTATKSITIGAKILKIGLYSVSLCKLRLFFE